MLGTWELDISMFFMKGFVVFSLLLAAVPAGNLLCRLVVGVFALKPLFKAVDYIYKPLANKTTIHVFIL